jgi:hypothetical protein
MVVVIPFKDRGNFDSLNQKKSPPLLLLLNGVVGGFRVEDTSPSMDLLLIA